MNSLVKKISFLFACILLLVGCSAEKEETYPTITNAVTLVSKKADMSGYRFLNDENHAFMEISAKESIRMFEEGGTGILYYGYVGCPWCERAVVELNKVAKENHIKVYYIDVYAPDMNQEVFDGLDKHLSPIYDNGQFKVPEVVAVKNGEILGHHLALVDGFKPVGDDQMSDAQKKELDQIYLDLIMKVAD